MMSRFEIDKDGITVFDNHTGSLFECKYSNEAESLCKLLNMFEEKTEDLIHSNNTMKKIIDKKNELQDEDFKKNAWLQTKYTEACIELDFLKDENAHMRQVLEENKQLKKENNELKEFQDRVYRVNFGDG